MVCVTCRCDSTCRSSLEGHGFVLFPPPFSPCPAFLRHSLTLDRTCFRTPINDAIALHDWHLVAECRVFVQPLVCQIEDSVQKVPIDVADVSIRPSMPTEIAASTVPTAADPRGKWKEKQIPNTEGLGGTRTRSRSTPEHRAGCWVKVSKLLLPTYTTPCPRGCFSVLGM